MLNMFYDSIDLDEPASSSNEDDDSQLAKTITASEAKATAGDSVEDEKAVKTALMASPSEACQKAVMESNKDEKMADIESKEDEDEEGKSIVKDDDDGSKPWIIPGYKGCHLIPEVISCHPPAEYKQHLDSFKKKSIRSRRTSTMLN